MADLDSRIEDAARALQSLRDALAAPAGVVGRDAAILRFAYTSEAMWKAAKAALLDRHGLEANSPKMSVRMSRRVGWLADSQATSALAMLDDRNLVVHTYNEPLAAQLALRLPGHINLLGLWLDAVRNDRAAPQV
jgi:Nucleotidyltransferase substrate binding protein like